MTNSFTWGFDGWIYAMHGFSNESKVKGSDRKPIIMQSGNTYRMRPDGSHLEFYTTARSTRSGSRSTRWETCTRAIATADRSIRFCAGRIIRASASRTTASASAPKWRSTTTARPASPASFITRPTSFPRSISTRVMVGNVVTNRINQDTIEWHGSTPKAIEQPDFLVSDDPWFRPVDLEIGPDGALYVADFYNRIIGHYEVPVDASRTRPRTRTESGGFTIEARVGSTSKRPDGYTEDVQKQSPPKDKPVQSDKLQIQNDLFSPNLTRRIRAANRYVDYPQGKLAAPDMGPLLLGKEGLHSRSSSLDSATQWKAERGNHLPRVNVSNRLVRVHALKIVGERSEVSSDLMEKTRKALTDPDAFVRRAAAEALGRHPEMPNVWALLALRPTIPNDDTHLIHVVRMALRDQLLEDEAWLISRPPVSARGQMDDLADVAPGVHTVAAANFLYHHVTGDMRSRGALAKYVHHIARYGGLKLTESLLAFLPELS